MQVNHSEVAAASRIGTASATYPVLRILSAIVFVSAAALMAWRSEKLQETPSITFTKIPPAAQGGREKSGYDLWTVQKRSTKAADCYLCAQRAMVGAALGDYLGS